MRILGFNFEKISSERKKPLTGEIKINSNITINKIEEEKIDIMKEQALKFNFTFSITYSEAANVVFEGFVVANVEKEEYKEILKEWKKKKIPDKYRIPLFNSILARCSTKALQLEEDLNLPPHIPMPQIRPKDSTNYTG